MKNVTLASFMLETIEDNEMMDTAAYQEFINHPMVSVSREDGCVYFYKEDNHAFVENIYKTSCLSDLENSGSDFLRVGKDEIDFLDILQEMINKEYASGVVITDIYAYVEANKKEIAKIYYQNLINAIDSDEISIKLG